MWRRSFLCRPSVNPSGWSAPLSRHRLRHDIRPDGSGFNSLEDKLEVYAHPIGPTAHTPRGGCALLFKWPEHFVKTCSGELAPHLDIRGDRGSVILPPGPGRFWDAHLGKDTPIPEMPAWMMIANPPPADDAPVQYRPARPQRLSRYAEAALDNAVKAIIDAPDGQQRETLNREVYSIARLVAGDEIPVGLALEALHWVARRIRSYDSRRPWRPNELDKIVRTAFADGLARPRQPERIA